MELNEKQYRVLFHALGISDVRRRKPKPYRNYYCATETDAPFLNELVALGAMRLYAERGGYLWYCCTDAGRAAALEEWYKRRPSKAKRRYTAYVHNRDVHGHLTFKDFLTKPEWAEARNNA